MMRTNYLFPFYSRWLGIGLILVHIPIKFLWDARYPGGYNHMNPASETSGFLFSPPHLFFIGTTLMVLIGLFLIAFSRERVEDEQITQLPLDSLRWAIYLNYGLLLFSLVFTHGGESEPYISVEYLAALTFFILRFQWVLTG